MQSIPFLKKSIGRIPNSVIEDKKAHLILCLLGANDTEEVSHEGDKIILRSQYSIKADGCLLGRRGVGEGAGKSVFKSPEESDGGD